MRKHSLFIVLLCLVAIGCSRQPSDKSLANMSKSYFNSYGRKYKTTGFGLSKIASAKIEETHEWHKGLVEGEVTLTHRDASTSHVRCMFQRNDPFGWKIVSWENLR